MFSVLADGSAMAARIARYAASPSNPCARPPGAEWATPGILEALIPGRMQGYGGTEEVPG